MTSNVNVNNLNNLCRTCLTRLVNNGIGLDAVLSQHDVQKTLRECLKECLLKDVLMEDQRLPNRICKDCCRSLEIVFNFMLIARKSETILRKKLLQMGQHTKSEEQSLLCLQDGHLDKNGSYICRKRVNIKSADKANAEFSTADNGQIKFLTKTATIARDAKAPQDFKSKTTLKLDTKAAVFQNCHQTELSDIRPYSCRMCNFQTGYIEGLRKHYQTLHSVIVPYQELYAAFGHSNKTSIPNLLAVDTSKAYSCTECQRSFANRKALNIHFTMKHNRKEGRNLSQSNSFTCEKCAEKFQTKVGLVVHQRYCMLQQVISCDMCHEKFITNFTFEQHLKLRHGVTSSHCCQTCGKSFSDSKLLAIHCKRHNERKFQCMYCERDYINETELQVHINSRHKGQQLVTAEAIFKDESLTSMELNDIGSNIDSTALTVVCFDPGVDYNLNLVDSDALNWC